MVDIILPIVDFSGMPLVSKSGGDRKAIGAVYVAWSKIYLTFVCNSFHVHKKYTLLFCFSPIHLEIIFLLDTLLLTDYEKENYKEICAVQSRITDHFIGQENFSTVPCREQSCKIPAIDLRKP